MKRYLSIGCLIAILCIAGCGDRGPSAPPSTQGPDSGRGSLLITTPDTHQYQTNLSSIKLLGQAFVPDGVSCGHFTEPVPPGYNVTWTNFANGRSGTAGANVNCLLIVFTHWETTDIPLSPGENKITVTADDSLGNIGRDTITVNLTQ